MEPLPQHQSTSVWDYKPWWCQPWSILLTGVSLISGSFILFRIIWLTLLVAIPLVAWMGYFIVIYPALFRASLESLEPSPHDNPSQNEY